MKRSHRWPNTIGPALYDEGADQVRIIVQSSSGPLVAGDSFAYRVRAEAGAGLRLHGQGAVSVNAACRGSGTAEKHVLEAFEGSHLAWYAEPRILHSGADHVSTIDIDIDDNSSVVLVDSFVVHPDAVVGRYRSVLNVRRAGVVVVRDRSELDIGGLAGQEHACFGAVWLVGESDDRWGEEWSQRASKEVYAAGSRLPCESGFVVRIAANSGLGLRRAVDAYLPDIGSAL